MGNNLSFMDNLAEIFLEFLRKQAGIVVVLVGVVVGLIVFISKVKEDSDNQHALLRSEIGALRTDLRQCQADKEELRVRLGKAETEIELIINRRRGR